MRYLLTVMTATVLASMGANAQQTVYGGNIAPKDVSKAVEECEYRMLVEEQTCNKRINKSKCLKEIRRFCLENADDPAYQEGLKATRKKEPETVEETEL